MDIKKLDTIVFSGGGVRGLAYAGMLMAFQDTFGLSISEHFKTFVGTSIGALFALVCALGISTERALGILEAKGLGLIFQSDPTCLLTHYALNSGAVLESVIKELLLCYGPAGGNVNVTLEELFALTGKKLVITVVDLLSSNTLYLDHTNEGRKISVLKALMGSTALPPLFPPVSVTVGDRLITDHYLFTDGGLLDNFPIAQFDPEKTLGVRTTWYIDPASPMSDISSYYTRVLSIMQLTMHSIQQKISEGHKHVILIDLGLIVSHNTNINQQEIIFKGYRASIAKFSNSFAEVDNTENAVKYLGGAPQLPAYMKAFKINAEVHNVP